MIGTAALVIGVLASFTGTPIVSTTAVIVGGAGVARLPRNSAQFRMSLAGALTGAIMLVLFIV